MKICWDTLEGMYLSRNGYLRRGSSSYVEMDVCKWCGDPYLSDKGRLSMFCSSSCARCGENNPFFGKIHTIESRKKMSKNSPSYKGSLCPSYRGGVFKLGLVTYSAYKDKLGIYEETRKQKNTEILEAKCVYCGKWFSPTRGAVNNRLAAINVLSHGEGRLYCSENCKQACPTYGKKLYPKGFKHVTSREVSTYLRQMVLERDNWTCQICGKTSKEAQLHCHHMDPATQNPMFQNVMDSCITLCKDCHKVVHRQRGCRYIDLRCKKEIVFKKNK